ncbi:hypothetical protein GSF67_18610 [Agrobacterium sp. CGMCC 11546]|nr:hypothetical protein GSF67_18610 [Agrobacterium sp. CGMCC 11546]
MTVRWHNLTIRPVCVATGVQMRVQHVKICGLFFIEILPDDHDVENSCFSGPVDPVARMAPRGKKIPFLCPFRLGLSKCDAALAVGGFRQSRRLFVGNG